VAYVGKEKVNTEFWWGNLTERNHLEDLGIDERVILKYIFKDWLGNHRLDLCISE
jgi:hypothetical protein